MAGEIAYVNGTGKFEAGSDSTIVADATNHSTGNLLVVFVGMLSYTETVSSIADTAGNSYTFIRRLRNGAVTLEAWYAKSITGNASNVVTVTYTGSIAERSVIVLQYSGCDKTSPLDQWDSATGSSSTPTSDNETTTLADEVLVAGANLLNSKDYTAGANYTLRVETDTPYAGAEDRIVSSIGTYNATFSLSGSTNWVIILATFKGNPWIAGSPLPTHFKA